MADGRRSYGQYCGLADALDVIGDRWTMLILRELMIGPCRYNELLANLPGIGTNLLADRLKLLTREGLVEYCPQDEGSRGKRYRLTGHGEALRKPLLGIVRWGLSRLDEDAAKGTVRPRWAMLALEAMIDDSQASDIDESYEFDIDGETFHIAVHEGKTQVSVGPADRPGLIARTDARTFVDIGAGRLGLLEASLTHRLVMEGDFDCVARCCRLLGLMRPE